MRLSRIVPLALAASACNAVMQPAGMIPTWTTDWKRVATQDDRDRLRDWRATLTTALAAARKSGHGAEIDREGVLLNPDAALASPAIPDGMYRCRVIKVGAKQAGLLNYVSYPAFNCRIQQEGALQGFAKLSGSQRQIGSIFGGDALRQVFLGTLVLGDEPRAMQYGRDTDRDVAGYVERIGPSRWRLIMPRPAFESQLDVMELVPSSPGVR